MATVDTTHSGKGEMEIQKDYDQLQSTLLRGSRQWDKAMERYINLTELWENISQRELGHLLRISEAKHEAGPIPGSVLTKEFLIHHAPLLTDSGLMVEVTIEVLFTRQKTSAEAFRFRVDVHGSIYDQEGELILSANDDMPGFTLILNIVQAILSTETPATSAR